MASFVFLFPIGAASENLWSPPFSMSLLACVNLFGVVVGITPRATMKFAPDSPKNGSSLKDLFSEQVCRQAAVPFTSSIFQSSQNQLGDS
jgi:hypothetical protein